MAAGKVIIISAPSGCGKSTIIGKLMERGDINMQFSVSATNRSPRGSEVDGTDYHFLSDEEFRSAIAADAFLEYEEVYPGRFYGTLRSEIDRIAAEGSNVVLDIDVNGGIRVKQALGSQAISIFIEPPSIEALRSRLEGRGTDSPESIDARIDRARYELDQAPRYDARVVNDNLDEAVDAVRALITEFLERN
ncbi:MAG: guanylate kinase [Muribaculaceae bacterium]|nr:guanylate kinase [Muribaculaceae bacterium]